MSFRVSKVIISCILLNKRVANSFGDELNDKTNSMCKHNAFAYIYNGNMSILHLFDDGLHLLEPGVCILANNFTCSLNYILQSHLHHLKIHFEPKI